jgi:tripartite-type tricarboxylate transporter receptor subunit TctC
VDAGLKRNTIGGAKELRWKNFASVFCAVFLPAAMVAPLAAQSYPDKPIRFIVPQPPGGGGLNDTIARLLGPKLAERFGQSVVVDNRPGAGGRVGTELVAKARPDGYTIGTGGPGSITISPIITQNLGYDPIKDLAPVAPVAESPFVLVARAGLPVKSLKDLVAYAKASPGKLSYGSPGVGTSPHLAFELLRGLVGIDIVHVPYKGASPMLIGLIGGEIDVLQTSVSVALPQIQSGRVNALAVLHSRRQPLLPGLPTAKEAGIDNYEVRAWYGIFAPGGTPRRIVSRLNAELMAIVATPEMKEEILKLGLERMSATPDEFSGFLKEEMVRWGKVVKEANISSMD